MFANPLLIINIPVLHVEYEKYGILFILSLFYEDSNLECVHIYVIYRVRQAEYVIRIRVDAPQEYVNTYQQVGSWFSTLLGRSNCLPRLRCDHTAFHCFDRIFNHAVYKSLNQLLMFANPLLIDILA